MTRPGLETHTGAVRQRLGDGLPPTCRVLLVGETNPYGARPEFALYCEPESSAGGRLQRLVLALPRPQYLAIWRANLCVGGFDRWEANTRAAELLIGDRPWDVIVALGVKVAREMWSVSGSEDEAWRPWSVHRGLPGSAHRGLPGSRTVVCIPHPSGRNAEVWGKEGAFERARQLVRAAAPELWA